MTDQQQQQQQNEERRPADIEAGTAEVPLENEEEEKDSSSSPAAAYRDLYLRMNPSQQSIGALPSVSEHGGLALPPNVRTSSVASSACSTLDDIGVSRGCLEEEESEDELLEEDDAPSPSLPVRRTVSAVSHVSNVTKKYDLNGKGYLDDTEKAMRALDTENMGTLDMHKVYLVMKEMQQQQKELHEQQKSFANLRKVVIALACFSMILALANLGTAFAAATLAKDTTVDARSGALLAKGTGEMISTVSKGSVINVEDMAEPENIVDRRRRELRVARRAVALGRLGLGGPVETMSCPHPAMGVTKEKDLKELRKNVDNGVPYVTLKYTTEDPKTGDTLKTDMPLHIEESNYDENNDSLHIRATYTFRCEEDGCPGGMVGQYRLAPVDLSFQPLGKDKYGIYSCHRDGPVAVGGGGLGGGLSGGSDGGL